MTKRERNKTTEQTTQTNKQTKANKQPPGNQLTSITTTPRDHMHANAQQNRQTNKHANTNK